MLPDDGLAARGHCSLLDATIAYATYVWERSGRHPAYAPPLRTVRGFRANHVDVELYDHLDRPEVLAAIPREHLVRWHDGTPTADPAR